MTTVAELVRKARIDGVEVIVRDGRLKARGDPEALAVWVPALRSRKQELLELMGETPEPRPDWRVLARAYDAHHFNCPACIAAGKLRDGSRCPVGRVLWASYEEAAQ